MAAKTKLWSRKLPVIKNNNIFSSSRNGRFEISSVFVKVLVTVWCPFKGNQLEERGFGLFEEDVQCTKASSLHRSVSQWSSMNVTARNQTRNWSRIQETSNKVRSNPPLWIPWLFVYFFWFCTYLFYNFHVLKWTGQKNSFTLSCQLRRHFIYFACLFLQWLCFQFGQIQPCSVLTCLYFQRIVNGDSWCNMWRYISSNNGKWNHRETKQVNPAGSVCFVSKQN